MKKMLIVSLAVASILLQSCQKCLDTNQSLLKEINIETGSSNITRSHYYGEGRQEWSYGDRMSIFDGYGTRSFVTYNSGPTVNFSGYVDNNATSIVAVYPERDRNAILPNYSVLVDFPSMQIACRAGFADGSNPMVGKTAIADPMSLEMHNVGSFLKFSIPDGSGIDISSVFIVSGGGEVLSGTIPVDVSGDTPTTASGTGFINVTLVPDMESEYLAPGTYFAVVPPVELSGGLSFVAKRADGKVGIKSGTTPNTLTRNTSKDLGTIDIANMEWVESEEYANRTIVLDFSSQDVFTESLPKGKTIGTKKYTTLDGNSFIISIDDSAANTRGAGWMITGNRLAMYNNTFYLESDTSETTDGLILPAFEDLRLKSVSIDVGQANTFQAVVLNPDGTLVKGGMDEDSSNWQKNTVHKFSLKGTKPGTRYKISARAANTFIYMARLTLIYEKIGIPALLPSNNTVISDINDSGVVFNW